MMYFFIFLFNFLTTSKYHGHTKLSFGCHILEC